MTWTIKEPKEGAYYDYRNYIIHIEQGDVPIIYSTRNYALSHVIRRRGNGACVNAVVVTCLDDKKVSIWRHQDGMTKKAKSLTLVEPFAESLDALEMVKALKEALALDLKVMAQRSHDYINSKLQDLPQTFESDDCYFEWCKKRDIDTIDPHSYAAKYWTNLGDYPDDDIIKFSAVRPRVRAIERGVLGYDPVSEVSSRVIATVTGQEPPPNPSKVEVPRFTEGPSYVTVPAHRIRVCASCGEASEFTTIRGGTLCDDCL